MGKWFGSFTGAVEVIVSIFHKGNNLCYKKGMLLPEEKQDDFVVRLQEPCVIFGGDLEDGSNPDSKVVWADSQFHISVVPLLTFKQGENFFYWSYSKTTNGDHLVFEDPENILKKGKCEKWTDGLDCQLTPGGTDLCFVLSGKSEDMTKTFTKENAKELLIPAQACHGMHHGIGGDISHDGVDHLLASSDVRKMKDDLSNGISRAVQQTDSTMDEELEREDSIGGTPAWVIATATVCSVGFVLVVALIGFFVIRRRSKVETF